MIKKASRRTCTFAHILDASSAADFRLSPMNGTIPRTIETASRASMVTLRVFMLVPLWSDAR
jgi:hypothetical protein